MNTTTCPGAAALKPSQRLLDAGLTHYTCSVCGAPCDEHKAVGAKPADVTKPQLADELNKLIDALLEDHIDMYNQDRDSSAALGEDIETFKQAIRTKYISRQSIKIERLEAVRDWLQWALDGYEPLDRRAVAGYIHTLSENIDDLRHELGLEGSK